MSTENNEAVSSLSSNSREASPPTAVIAKYIVIMLIAAIIIVLFGIKPSLEGYFNNNSKISQQLQTNTMNKTTFDELRNKQNNLSKTKTQVDDFLKSFPANADQTAMLSELNKIAAANGVTINSIAPTLGTAADKKKVASSDLVAPINIDMALSGGDPNKFLADLEKSSRVFVINSLSYTGGDKDAKTMAIKATTFVVQPLANPNLAPPAGQTEPAAPAPTAPAVPMQTAPAPEPSTPATGAP